SLVPTATPQILFWLQAPISSLVPAWRPGMSNLRFQMCPYLVLGPTMLAISTGYLGSRLPCHPRLTCLHSSLQGNQLRSRRTRHAFLRPRIRNYVSIITIRTNLVLQYA